LIEAADGRSEEDSVRPVPISTLSGSSIGWKYAIAAAILLLIAGAAWIAIDRARLNAQISQLAAEADAVKQRERELATKIAEEQSRAQALQTELDRYRAERAVIENRSPDPTQDSSPNVISMLLSPVLVRTGSGVDPQVLTIPKTTDAVRLQVRTAENDGKRFHVSVRTVEGRTVFTQQSIKPQHVQDGSVVTIQVPAANLKTADYILTLSAVKANRREELNRYFFRVTRQ
jgi:hypothetical protein